MDLHRVFSKSFAAGSLAAVAALCIVTASHPRAEDASGSTACPLEHKVTELLGQWKAATEESKALTDAQRQQIAAQVAALKAECPVGSRLGSTVEAVRDVLGAAIACEEANAGRCPVEVAIQSSKGQLSPALAEAKQLKEAHSKAIRGLHELASYVAGVAAHEDCTRAQGKAASSATVAKTGAACSEAASACPVRLASRIGALKASWATAPAEVKALSESKRKALLTAGGNLAETCKAAALVPPSAMALAEGFDGLEKLHERIVAWAKANPEIFGSAPQDLHLSFALQAALFDETRELLSTVRETMGAMAPVAQEAKAETEVGTAKRS